MWDLREAGLPERVGKEELTIDSFDQRLAVVNQLWHLAATFHLVHRNKNMIHAFATSHILFRRAGTSNKIVIYSYIDKPE